MSFIFLRDGGSPGVPQKARAASTGTDRLADARSDIPVSERPTHRLVVTSEPNGARVVVDVEGAWQEEGVTPFRAMVPEGAATLELSLEGFDTVTEELQVTGAQKKLVWLDPPGLIHHKRGEFATGSLPKQVAFTPEGDEIWVTTLGESGVEVYDSHTMRRLREIDTGEYGTVEVIFTSDGRTAYVSQMQTAQVFEIDTKSYEIRRTIPTGSEWSKVMTLSPDEKRLYVANWSGSNVSEIDLRNGHVRRQVDVVDTPRGLYVTPDGKYLFVAGFEHGELQMIDLATGASEIILETGGAMRHIVGDGEGHIYADDMGTNETFVVDLTDGDVSSDDVRKLSDTDNLPNTIDITPDGNVLYVSNRGKNNPTSYSLPGPEWGTVLAIDTESGEILDAIIGGNQPTGLDVSADGSLIAYSDFLDNRVSVYEIPSYDALREGDGGRADERFEDIKKEAG
jgi:YVTN family beta-propeller protein